MKLFFLLIIAIVSFSSCEVYEKYFVTVLNRYDKASITVKVTDTHYLPKKYINASTSNIGCHGNTNILKDNNFNTQIPISVDTAKAEYNFILPPCLTAWLQPTKVGPPAIEYIVIDKKDTVYINSKSIKKTEVYKFKKEGQQKFLLTIKAP